MISIGVRESNLFFYYHSLAIENGTLQKSEAFVSARDLRGAILKRLPRYGMRPGHINSIATLSAVLFTMEQGKWARAQHDSLTFSCLYKTCLSRFLNFEISVIHFSFSFVSSLRLWHVLTQVVSMISTRLSQSIRRRLLSVQRRWDMSFSQQMFLLMHCLFHWFLFANSKNGNSKATN